MGVIWHTVHDRDSQGGDFGRDSPWTETYGPVVDDVDCFYCGRQFGDSLPCLVWKGKGGAHDRGIPGTEPGPLAWSEAVIYLHADCVMAWFVKLARDVREIVGR